ncbi:hypothetical protein [Snuella lapsa]|uniref:DUF4292 domain-containing protein n=1 Tax=Snuella lapsa TaxID=870481 RepID=A0ABP6XNP1_9FLAO
MNKLFFPLIITAIILTNCNKTQDPFQIGKQHIGSLTDSTQVKDLETVFKNDSIVKFTSGDEFAGNRNSIKIFEKGGKHLLTLTPRQALDSLSVIENVQIIDPRYKTDKNVSILSTFKDLSNTYKISRIDNLINSVLITVNELNASFSIAKSELPANLRFDMNLNLETTHIPDEAKLKYFFINWYNN